ncbi:MAG: patatin-like phospholipase family protein [Acidobacteriota bacterium]|nr:patatin-like phospholipase family protein [Acidobacteriota bacterium]
MVTPENEASHQRFQVLALSGGGYRGLYTAQILADLEAHFKTPAATHFELLAGTSVGGILALALALEIPASKIVELFEKHGAEIFKRRARWAYFKSNYSSASLRELLEQPDLFGQRRLRDCLHPLIVPAINFTAGKPVLFKTDHHPSFVQNLDLRAVDVALATSAAPIYFPRHIFQSNQYVDGGLFANAPGILALHEAEFFFRRRADDVHLMAVGTMSAKYTVDPRKDHHGGARSWGGWNPINTSKQLFGLAISTQETLVDFMLQQRLGDRYCHVDDDLKDEQARAVGLDTATAAATEVLVGSAHERAKWVLGNEACRKFFSHPAAAPTFFHRS